MPTETPETLVQRLLPTKLILRGRAGSVKAAVQVGDEVHIDQPLERCDAIGATTPAAISPVEGRIAAIAVGADGQNVYTVAADPRRPSASIEMPPANFSGMLEQLQKPAALTLTTLLAKCAAMGLESDRTTSPSLLEQLAAGVPVSVIIISAVDGDDTVRLNAMEVETDPASLMVGACALRAAATSVGGKPPRTAVVIGPTISAAAERELVRLAKTSGVEVLEYEAVYPFDHPTLLLRRVMGTGVGTSLRPDALPTTVGAIVVDGTAAADIGRLLRLDRPLTRRVVAVRDHLTNRTFYSEVPIGTPLSEIITDIGRRGGTAQTIELRQGDVLEGRIVERTDVVAFGSGVYHILPSYVAVNPSPCVRCGWCTAACPTKLQPAGVLSAAQAHDGRGDPALARRYGVEACIECGLCQYLCPSELPLLDALRAMKSQSKAEIVASSGGAEL